jgi:hypothetical protein
LRDLMENFGRLIVEQMVIAAARKAELGPGAMPVLSQPNQGTALAL